MTLSLENASFAWTSVKVCPGHIRVNAQILTLRKGLLRKGSGCLKGRISSSPPAQCSSWEAVWLMSPVSQCFCRNATWMGHEKEEFVTLSSQDYILHSSSNQGQCNQGCFQTKVTQCPKFRVTQELLQLNWLINAVIAGDCALGGLGWPR